MPLVVGISDFCNLRNEGGNGKAFRSMSPKVEFSVQEHHLREFINVYLGHKANKTDTFIFKEILKITKKKLM